MAIVTPEKQTEESYTKEQAFNELEEARQLAREQKDPAAMVEAIRGKAKLFGLEIDNIVITEITAQKGFRRDFLN
ncbi:MAG: hypothetical protein ACYS1A_18135 [Planctomycetota bacterium]|jgi:hypothetical protein